MKNINHIISGLTRSGLFAKQAKKHPYYYTSAYPQRSNRWRGQQLSALAMVGRVAWQAYQAYSRQPQPSNNKPPNTGSSTYTPARPSQSFTYSPSSLKQQQFAQVVEEESGEQGPTLILRAMISAANADGHIDDNERQRIYQQLDKVALSAEQKTQLFDELRAPLSLAQLIANVTDTPTAVEVYVASLMVMDTDCEQAQAYLQQLAVGLQLPDRLIAAIHAQPQA